MTAARAVGHDQGIRRRLANCGQKAALRHSHGNFVVLCFVTERSRHAATTRVDDLDREAGNELQRGDNGGHRSKRFLVTVAVEKRLARTVLAKSQIRCSLCEFVGDELLEQKGLRGNRIHGVALQDGFQFVAEGERSEEHTSELQSRQYLVCRLLLEKKKK